MRFITILTVLLSAVAWGQSEDRNGIKVRFLAERLPQGIAEVVMTAENRDNSAPFKLTVNGLTTPLTAPARAFQVKPDGATEESPALAKVALPEDGKSFIVLLIPATTGGYSPLVISAEDPKFKPGDSYIYNHSDKPVLGYVGTASFVLQPGKGQTLTPKGAKPEGFFDVGFGVREAGVDRTLSTTRWPVEPNIRSYVFFFVNPANKRLDFRVVDEFVAPAGAPS